MTLAPGWTTIPSKIRSDLSIEHGQCLSVLDVKRLKPHSSTPFHIKNGKIDILSLIPEVTSKGYRLYVDKHEKGSESWLSVWYHHRRGAARQIELRRYVNASKLGQLLGQLQAEGNKQGSSVVFKNSSISEHADFVTGLRELGISNSCIRARCIFNPNKSSPRDVREYSEKYRTATGIRIRSFDKGPAMKGAIVADTLVRSSTLMQILLFAMDEIRRGSYRSELVRRNFLAKLLSGDGSLDSRKTAKRLDVRVKIVDQNVEYLYDYAAILVGEGFRAKVRAEKLTVRSYCTWLNLLTLYEIGAFRGTRSWIKLLCSLKIAIAGKQTRGYERIRQLSEAEAITSRDVCISYRIGKRAANLWLVNMQRLGLIERSTKIQTDRYNRYCLTQHGKNAIGLINDIECEYCEMSQQHGSSNPESILKEAKTKSGVSLRSSEQGT